MARELAGVTRYFSTPNNEPEVTERASGGLLPMDQMGAEFFRRLYGISRFLANNSLAITSNWSKEMSVMQRESAFPDCADGLVLGNS